VFAGTLPPPVAPPVLKQLAIGQQLLEQHQHTPPASAASTGVVASQRHVVAPPPRKQLGVAGVAAGAMTAPAKAPSSRTFAKQRQQLAQELYALWNAQVFDGGLPGDLPLVWNPRLTATAGQVVDDGSRNHAKAHRQERIPVRLELSSKVGRARGYTACMWLCCRCSAQQHWMLAPDVNAHAHKPEQVLDCEARLRTTLAHEMCHVGAWAISREFKQHHGPAFWAWARRFERRVPDIHVTTCHNYEVHAPFRWQCSNYRYVGCFVAGWRLKGAT
jgi:hypothetical protein